MATDRITRRFDFLRQQAEQDANAQQQQQAEGLTRQAAAHGRLGSGVYTKLAEKGANEITKAKNQNILGIEANRDAALGAVEEADANREFARSERLGGQEFMSQQNKVAQEFARGEREASQGFARGEREAGQGFARGEREGAQGFAAEQNKMAQKLQSDQFNKQLSVSQSQFKDQMAMALKQFNFDKEVSRFNMNMAEKMFNKPSIMGGAANILNTATGGMFGPTGGGPLQSVLGGPAQFIGQATGGGGGGKIICTEYARNGWLPLDILKADLDYQKHYTPIETIKNYLAWAKYLVPVISKYPLARYLFWPISKVWAYEMAFLMGVVDKRPFGGAVMHKVLIFTSNVIGSVIRKIKSRRSVYA